MSDLLVLLGSLGLISLIVWWFLMKPERSAVTAEVSGGKQTIAITASGGYTPNKIVLREGIPAKLVFIRKDPSSCLEEVILPDFGVQRKLPVNREMTVDIKPEKAGRYTYSCGMHMFFGEIIVK